MMGATAERIRVKIELPPAKALHFQNRESANYGHGMPALRMMEFLAEGHNLDRQGQEYLRAINPLRTRNHDADWLRKCYKQLRRQALLGNGEALNDLGWIISNELCYPAHQDLATDLFRLAAVTGCAGEAWFNLAEQLHHELLHESDSVKKQSCFYRMAEVHGIAAAATRLGYLYWGSVDGHELDLEQARQWLLRGAKRGDTEAAYQLGMLLLDPDKPVHDQGNALYWLQSAALNDEPQAISHLCEFYESEEGCRLDPGGRMLAFWNEQAERCNRLHHDPDNDFPYWPYKLRLEEQK